MEPQIKKQSTKNMEKVEVQKIAPFLWFDTQAEQAANFYTTLFKDSKIKSINYYGPEGALASGREEGSVMTVGFMIEGQEFTALNGGPVFEISPAISLLVNCDTEAEINLLWEKLAEGGTILMALNKYPFSEKYGWLKDQYGVTWQLTIDSAMQKITPFLMFAGKVYGKAEEAMNFYVSLFDQSGIIHIERHGPADEEFEGTVKQARFSLNEQEFMARDSNVGHDFTFTPALSFVVNCKTQEEIDHFWDGLSEGGDPRAQQCGWLQDRYGVSWQIVPHTLEMMMSDPDTAKGQRVMKAILPMKKLNLKTLQDAYEKD